MPAFGDIGKAAKDLLTGGFQYDSKVSVVGKATSGATITASGKKKDAAVSGDVKVAHNIAKGVTAEGTINSAAKIDTTVTMADVAPGLKCSVSASIPDKESGKLSLNYGNGPYGAKADVGLRGSPKVDLSAAAAFKPYTLGAAISYDSKKSVLSKYDFGVQYNSSDLAAALVVADKMDTVKVSYIQHISKDTSVAAELARKLKKGTTTFSLGASHKLGGGAVFKSTLDNTGIVSMLAQHDLRTGSTLIGSVQFDTKNLDKTAKAGLELKVKA